MKAKKTIGNTKDYITAMRKASRELEIALHGKQVSLQYSMKHSKKEKYDRNEFKKLSYLDES